MKKELNKEQVENLIKKGLKQKEIAKELNCTVIRLQRWLRKNNISMNKGYSNEIKNQVLELWKLNTSEKKIAEQVNLTVNQVRSIKSTLRKYIKLNNYTLTKVSDEVFKNIPLFWYLVGIFSSDGHLDSRCNSILIFQNDYNYLLKLKTLLKSNAKIYNSQKDNAKCYALRIYNKNFYNFLVNNGITSDKRYTNQLIECPKEYFCYYLRGIFDGDGCLSYRYISGRFEGKVIQITSGSKNFATKLLEILKILGFNSFCIQTKISNSGNKHYDIKTNNTNDIFSFCKYIYNSNFKFKLNKKYIKYIKLLKLYELDNKINDIVDTFTKVKE